MKVSYELDRKIKTAIRAKHEAELDALNTKHIAEIAEASKAIIPELEALVNNKFINAVWTPVYNYSYTKNSTTPAKLTVEHLIETKTGVLFPKLYAKHNKERQTVEEKIAKEIEDMHIAVTYSKNLTEIKDIFTAASIEF